MFKKEVLFLVSGKWIYNGVFFFDEIMMFL